MVKRLPTTWETQVWSLGQEDPLEESMATHASVLTWKITWMEEPVRLQALGSQRVRHDWATSLSFTFILKRHMRDEEERQAWSHCAAWRQAHRPCISSPGCQQDVRDKDGILLDSSPFYWVSFGTSLSMMAFQIGSCHGFWKIKAFQRIWCPMAM